MLLHVLVIAGHVCAESVTKYALLFKLEKYNCQYTYI
jgi:hypothetical protein